jgi:hypothetical protein
MTAAEATWCRGADGDPDRLGDVVQAAIDLDFDETTFVREWTDWAVDRSAPGSEVIRACRLGYARSIDPQASAATSAAPGSSAVEDQP